MTILIGRHFQGAGGALLVYDITKDKTFENLAKWIEDLKDEADKDIVIYIIGNKLDLIEKTPQQR
jgi:GTPase SAR1 family protein